MGGHSKVGADLIFRALARRHGKDLFLTQVKNGPSWGAAPGDLLQMDALAIRKSWTRPEVIAYEVKVSRSDFMADTKWPGYRDYCHRLYFACPTGLIKAEELADDVGLVYYNPGTEGLYTAKKALYRDIGFPPAEMLHYILMWRQSSDHHPFFSSRRDQLEAWVRDKGEREALGRLVSGAIREELKRLAEVAGKAERDAQRYRRLRDQLDALGVHVRDGDLPWDFKDRLTQSLPPRVDGLARSVLQQATRLVAEIDRAASKDKEVS